ncbi:MAG: cytochrome c maturation protein CcmE [Dehalococcoidia bacterium]|nr:cytochrome c maturation protein CcmE [Dehalococcoidia bacterium]MSQ17829.1 cytochrome c maturation protein CcmE [Dehalococcoidia bacterium]
MQDNPLGTPPPTEHTGSASGSNRFRFIILGAVLALAVGYMAYAAFPGNAQYFLTVNEFLGQPSFQDGRTVRVSGRLMEGTFQRPGESITAQFQLMDKTQVMDKAAQGPADSYLYATYTGVLPDLFFNPQSEIILEGRYGPDHQFHTDNILVKCPSKYRALEEEQG